MCQLYIWEQSHAFSSIVAFVYKLLWFPFQITSSMYSNVTTSTRINSRKCTYVHLCLFHSKPVQHVQFLHRVCWPYPIFNNLHSKLTNHKASVLNMWLDSANDGVVQWKHTKWQPFNFTSVRTITYFVDLIMLDFQMDFDLLSNKYQLICFKYTHKIVLEYEWSPTKSPLLRKKCFGETPKTQSWSQSSFH